VSATEVIEEIKKLPGEEQDKVLVFLTEERKRQTQGPAPVKYIDNATFEEAKNLVLNENAELLRRLAK
jgi:hypothetical protein